MEPERSFSINCAKQCLQWLSAGAAIVSACLWLISAFAKAKSGDRFESDGMGAYTLNDTKASSNIHETLRKQSKWNAAAALVASVAALAQGISMFVPG